MSSQDYFRQLGRTDDQLQWRGTFPDYVELIRRNPLIADQATNRLYRMILSHGVSTKPDGKIEYNFFKGKLFGADQQIDDIMMYLKASSLGLDIRKRVLLLLGPPGGGKSMILSLLKKGLADFSRTPDGSIYAIKGCPINEDPLHLLPENERKEFFSRYGVKIDGKLCPRCQFEYEKTWRKNLGNVEVHRIFIHEDNRVGIGTFAPAERNDMSELIGSVDLSNVDYFGSESDVRAYKFDGELHSANRGIMEFIEILKAKSDFLHILLTLAEERMFKTPRFPLQYVDETLIAHTNEGEFERFIAVKENEAVIDRLYIVRSPYNMDPVNEEKIYYSALEKKLLVKGVSIHPGALRLAAMFVVRTREHSDPLRRGMQGISPRFVLNSMAIAMVKTNEKVVKPIDMLNLLTYQITNYPVLDLETREKYLGFLRDLAGEIPRLNYLTNDSGADRKNAPHSGMFNSLDQEF